MLIRWRDVLRYCKNITGVIHVGAYTAEESKYYTVPTKWVEADPELAQALKDKGLECYNFAATNYVGTAILNRMPFRAANSLLEPNLNRRRKDVYVEDRIEVQADMISSIQEPGFNFLNLDIQGAELDALYGCDLSQIDYIYTECHVLETYFNCTQLSELDKYLVDFERVETKITKYGWGDTLYINNSIILET